jgi:hypothetical protein
MQETETEGFGARVLTWALIVGAALMFAEITWTATVPAKTATVQTVTVAAADTPVQRF